MISPEVRQVTPEEARQLTEHIRTTAENLWQMIAVAYQGRAWSALGYANWDDYCIREFGTSRLRLPLEERREAVWSLREAGLSLRAIAAVAQVDPKTVRNDLGAGGEPGRGNSPSGRQGVAVGNGQLGLDGRIYPQRQPPSLPPQQSALSPVPPVPQPVASPSQSYHIERGEVVYGPPPPQPAPAVNPFPPPAPAPQPPPAPRPVPVMVPLPTHDGQQVPYRKPQAKATFHESTGEGISWAAWSWNPVTGCLHGCRYCYARATASRWADTYPAGFTPVFHHAPDQGYTRLDAPANTRIPAAYRDDSHQPCGDGECKICAYRRVFVCSMADLYGRWVPDHWIKQVHESMLASPQWQYILLTKFPARYIGLDMPAGAWVGTSVDEQKRVRIAEEAFRQIGEVKVKWLSLEPLREPLEFTDLSVFDWVVIGAQTETLQPDGLVPSFAPPIQWVARLIDQAKEAGCKVHCKPNLQGEKIGPKFPGMQLPNEYPV